MSSAFSASGGRGGSEGGVGGREGCWESGEGEKLSVKCEHEDSENSELLYSPSPGSI